MERGQSFQEQSSRRPTPSEGPSDIAKTLPASDDDQTNSARDFEKRLQYAMQQSLVLQERQLKDIEILQEELTQEATGMSNRVIISNKKAVIEKIRKPLKGILKKSIARYMEVRIMINCQTYNILLLSANLCHIQQVFRKFVIFHRQTKLP